MSLSADILCHFLSLSVPHNNSGEANMVRPVRSRLFSSIVLAAVFLPPASSIATAEAFTLYEEEQQEC